MRDLSEKIRKHKKKIIFFLLTLFIGSVIFLCYYYNVYFYLVKFFLSFQSKSSFLLHFITKKDNRYFSKETLIRKRENQYIFKHFIFISGVCMVISVVTDAPEFVLDSFALMFCCFFYLYLSDKDDIENYGKDFTKNFGKRKKTSG